ncbi:unnamed protein product [marine sediment metagenome]|uniref:Uncharacterized protein n=1 Tax=marine sediment metagenome TaxID=412755 RepID=X1NYA2_9ZZZZ
MGFPILWTYVYVCEEGGPKSDQKISGRRRTPKYDKDGLQGI